MTDRPTANTPSEAIAMELCPMCLGHGTTHKFVPVEGLSECSGCGGAGTLDAFWAKQDADAGLDVEAIEADPGKLTDGVPPNLVPVERTAELRPFRHTSVLGRYPAGTDPLEAMREMVPVFMERVGDPWWHSVRWWHGSHAGFRRGQPLLPPTQTGVIPGLDTTDKAAVYITSDRGHALMFAARHDHPMLYEVTRLDAEPIPDDMMPDEPTCKRVGSCFVHRVEQPSHLELRRVLYELSRGD